VSPATDVLSPDRLAHELRAIGTARYHDKHSFHARLHSGRCTRAEVQAWALNRSYYQIRIPMKDAALIARCDDPDLRRIWRSRLEDHDGTTGADGGIARWFALTDALGFDRRDVLAGRGVLPITRFAVDAYVAFVRERTLLEAVASSLTELFAPTIVQHRLESMLRHYDYLDADRLAYFVERPRQAARDADYALGYVQCHARTIEQQKAVMAALTFKCDVLWAMLDALQHAYVEPGRPPPGAWVAAP
jgi:coenzyme PQQ biosynthesis protein C